MMCELRLGEGSSFIQITLHISLDFFFFFAFYVFSVSFLSSQPALPLGEINYGDFTEYQPTLTVLPKASLVQMLVISCT